MNSVQELYSMQNLSCIPNGTSIDVIRDIKRLGVTEFFYSWKQLQSDASNDVKQEVSNWEYALDLISKKAEIHSGAYIEPGAVIYDEVYVSEKAVIESGAIIKSGILCDTYVKSGVTIDAGEMCINGVITSDITQ